MNIPRAREQAARDEEVADALVFETDATPQDLAERFRAELARAQHGE